MAKAGLFSAALLAGGGSSRMGKDKAFLPGRDGKIPLWRQQVQLLQETAPDEILLSMRDGQDFQSMENVRLVVDTTQGAGPLAGILACLEQTRHPHLLCLAVDMPDMKVEFLQRLLSLREEGRCVVPRNGNRWEGIAALYAPTLAPLIQERLRGEDRSLQGLLHKAAGQGLVKPIDLTPEDLHCFANLNTPAEWDAWRSERPG